MTSSDEIYRRLQKGQSLDGLNLNHADGRLMIKGLVAPEPVPTGKKFSLGSLDFELHTGLQNFKQVQWKDIHFLACDLSNVSFHRCLLSDCVFEKCRCMHMGFWESEVADCSFDDCDLRNSALGGINDRKPKPNRYKQVRFDNSDFRDTAHSCEVFESCVFRGCRMDKVDFLGAVFENCLFQGDLSDVTFRSYDPTLPEMPRNSMSGCDFKDAGLSLCQFLNIDLDLSCFPNDDDDLIFLPHGPADWREWGRRIGADKDEGKRWYIDYVSQDAGTPSMASKSSLSGFTTEEVQLLIDIAKSKD